MSSLCVYAFFIFFSRTLFITVIYTFCMKMAVAVTTTVAINFSLFSHVLRLNKCTSFFFLFSTYLCIALTPRWLFIGGRWNRSFRSTSSFLSGSLVIESNTLNLLGLCSMAARGNGWLLFKLWCSEEKEACGGSVLSINHVFSFRLFSHPSFPEVHSTQF